MAARSFWPLRWVLGLTGPQTFALSDFPGPQAGPATGTNDGRAGQNRAVDLARTAWLTTVLLCLLAGFILLLQSYYGYAGVCLAVAISAAINLF